MLEFDQLVEFVKARCSAEINTDLNSTPHAVIIPSADLVPVCKALRDDPTTYFDLLSCVTALDNGPDAGTMELAYNLYSIPFHHHLAIRTVLHRQTPVIETVCGIWKTAEWHEREAYDMCGIIFNNHPDLRRILLPADWQGFPLRKDYKNPDYYHGIKFDY